MLRMFEASGDGEGARDLYLNGVRWYPELQPRFFRARIFGLAMRGDFRLHPHQLDRGGGAV